MVPSDGPSKSGIYAAPSQDGCCFLNKTATFILRKPPQAKSVLLNVYVSNNDYLRTHGQLVSAFFNGVSAGRPVAAHLGGQVLEFAIPAKLARQNTLNTKLVMSTSYVPKDLGINGDVRTLSLILVGVTFK